MHFSIAAVDSSLRYLGLKHPGIRVFGGDPLGSSVSVHEGGQILLGRAAVNQLQNQTRPSES
jgi:hypothetical protein